MWRNPGKAIVRQICYHKSRDHRHGPKFKLAIPSLWQLNVHQSTSRLRSNLPLDFFEDLYNFFWLRDLLTEKTF